VQCTWQQLFARFSGFDVLLGYGTLVLVVQSLR
jgi:hypothetical protein